MLNLPKSLPYLVPAIMYAVQNANTVLVLQYISPANFQFFSVLKIVFTALMFRAVFAKHFTNTQWVGVTLLVCAMLTSSMDKYYGCRNEVWGLVSVSGFASLSLPHAIVLLCECACTFSLSTPGVVQVCESCCRPNGRVFGRKDVRVWWRGDMLAATVRANLPFGDPVPVHYCTSIERMGCVVRAPLTSACGALTRKMHPSRGRQSGGGEGARQPLCRSGDCGFQLPAVRGLHHLRGVHAEKGACTGLAVGARRIGLHTIRSVRWQVQQWNPTCSEIPLSPSSPNTKRSLT